MELLATATLTSFLPLPTRIQIQTQSCAAVAWKHSLVCHRLSLPPAGGWCARKRRWQVTASCFAPVDTEALGEKRAKVLMAEKDLLVVGAGALGSLLAQSWLKTNPGCKVVGVTNTTKRHEELRGLGILPTLKQTESIEQFPYVIFCAPPSGSDDYPAELRLAAQRWNGLGSLLFTSSSAVYDCEDNGPCDENTPTFPLGVSSRADKLLNAEEEVLKVGGNVVRLAGLYSLDRGPHTYWLKLGTVESRPDHILNLIHIEDATSLCLAIMEKPFRSQIFMGCDGSPLSRQELMDLVNISEKYEHKFQKFTGLDGPLGKRMDNSVTCTKLGWKPKYTSFANFLGVA
ncbi:hypothetical protein O6H91_11G054300 [Diphasiastrum complanatum]|uniref:Uncharacterized protein n=1 Tax=Diphasiastrum complanatum TaxID=34168 RepID=A0ACC2C979_DIPCM|nr:hypothetical protein O6H91_11G054300 [Diphasiastrum complanatum]